MGIEAVEFSGGPADGHSQRMEAEPLEPGAELDISGAIYRIEGKVLGHAWRAVYVTRPGMANP